MLIELYCAVCHHYDTGIVAAAQRQSNNFCPQFTDEECITIYLWGIIEQKCNVKAIYRYTLKHYKEWFPKLPSYQAFNNRIGYLSDALKMLADVLLKSANIDSKVNTHLLDSMPIIVAGQKRSSTAKVAPNLCSKGYCGSKDMFYYGVKLHVLAQSRYQTLPVPLNIAITSASENDLTVAKQVMLCDVHNMDVFCDKAYIDSEWKDSMKQDNGVSILTPVKRKKGQDKLSFFDKLFSAAVSGVRQPIESFFNWLQETTHIHRASKVRSFKGLQSFIFARIAAACFLLNS